MALRLNGEIGKETAKAIDRVLAERNSTTAPSAPTIGRAVRDHIYA